MEIKNMMNEISNAQETMYGIKDLGIASFFSKLCEEIEHAYSVMRPL